MKKIIEKALKIRKFETFLFETYSKGYLNGTVILVLVKKLLQ